MVRTKEPPVAVRLDWRQPTQIQLTPILAAALEAFYHDGFHGTSVREISRRVGFSTPAIYYHHENKEAVLMALLDISINHVTDLCTTAVADGGSDPVLRFCNMIEALVLFEAFSPRTAFLDREMHALSPGNHAAYAVKRGRIQDLMLKTIEDGVDANVFEVRHQRETARALLGMGQAVWTWYRPGGPRTPWEVAANYVEMAARCAGAEPDVLTRIRTRYQSLPAHAELACPD
jgi:TetR/AcrR family transcriptional regulator, cholesterol catabolism regulator